MVQSQIENHESISDRFLEHADEQYALGALPQASEKAWGAVAHYLKAVAKSRGWPNSSHSDLNDIAEDLAHETNDAERAMILFDSAGDLHRNFYEDRLLDTTVGAKVEDTFELISMLKSRTGPPIEPRPSQTRR